MNIIERALAVDFQTVLQPKEVDGSITSLFSVVTNWITLIAGALAFIYLVYSGILYLTAAGNPDAAKKGQQGIINAIIGIIIIVAAWFIITAIANQANSSIN